MLREYGEERFALRIAQAIDRARRGAPLTSTAELAELVRDAIPAATRRHGGHPAKRTFQALRIEVNGELDALRSAVPAALDALRSADGSSCWPTTRWRTASSSRPGRARRPTPRRSDLPVPLAEHGPQLRLLARGSEPATDGRDRRQPAGRVRAAARRRTDPGDGMTRRATSRTPEARRRARRAPRSRCSSSA